MAAVGVRNLNNIKKKIHTHETPSPQTKLQSSFQRWRVMERVLSEICQVFDGLIYCEGYKR